jgi:hypothetical protein
MGINAPILRVSPEVVSVAAVSVVVVPDSSVEGVPAQAASAVVINPVKSQRHQGDLMLTMEISYDD